MTLAVLGFVLVSISTDTTPDPSSSIIPPDGSPGPPQNKTTDPALVQSASPAIPCPLKHDSQDPCEVVKDDDPCSSATSERQGCLDRIVWSTLFDYGGLGMAHCAPMGLAGTSVADACRCPAPSVSNQTMCHRMALMSAPTAE